MKRKTLLLAAALAGACTVVSIAGGEPTGCPDFEVEQPRAGLSPRASRPVIRATDFGLSEANEHNSAAINAALAEAKRVGAARVELAPGTYRCFDGGRGAIAQPDRSNIVIDGFTDFTFDGKGATLVFRRDHAPVDHQAAQLEGEANVEVRNCLRTVVEHFNMDWDWENDPLAVWAKCMGRHVDEADKASYADFELDRPHPKYPQHVPVQLLTPMSADRTGGRGHPMYFGMSLGHIGTKSEWLSPTRLRVWPFVKPDYGHFSPEALARYKPENNKRSVGNVDVGGTFVLAHGYYGLNGFVLTSNRHFTLRNVDIWACRGFGVETRGAQQYWQLVNVNVRSKPDAKYPVTSTADAHHVAQSLGFGKMVGCEVTLNQDDHFNYHDRTQIAWTRGPRTVEVVNNRGVAYTLFKVGSRIALRQEDFASTGWTGTIKRIDGEFITFDRDLPEQKGMLFVLMDADFATENFLFKDCWFHDSPWSRGLFNGSNATFDGCRFGPMTGRPLFLLACYTYNVWCEGVGCTNIVVRNCRFEDCLDLRKERGVCTQIMSEIAIPPSYVGMPLPISHPELARKVAENKSAGRALTPSEDALNNILVENCTFVNPRGYLFASRNGSNMTLRGNKVEWRGACEKLPYAGKVSVTGGRGNAVAAIAAGFAHAAEVPRPAFSFKYGDRAVMGSESLQVDAHLKVTVESVAYPQFNAVEWVLWFENPSAEKSAILSEIRDGNFLVSLPPQPKKFPGDIALPGERAVVTMNGCVSGIDYATDDAASAREFAAVTRTFHPWRGKGNVFEISNGCARPSDRQAPFFEVTQGGQGAIIAIGWTGGWRAKFADGAEGVRVETGIARARFYLEPGEKLRTSRVLVMNYAKGEDGANKFRRLLRKHFSHVASRPGVREGLFAYELWGGLTSAEMIRRVNTLKAKGFAYEDLWIDAGWYGNSTKCDDAYTGDWGRWTGDWVPNARIHPKGLEDVRDAAKDAGMGIMLWFEPERVVGSSNFAKQHPDLLLGSLLYYGNEKGRNYVRDLLADFAGRLNFSCYRQDFNMDPGMIMKNHDAKDREGITQIRHVTGLYQMWDELLARCPNLLIDNCSSGGRRIDIETLRRAVAFFRSDYQCGFNANADVLQAHNAGISRLLPYNGCTTKLSDAYTLRSAYSSSHGVAYWNAIFQKEEKVDWAAAKKCCDEYRRIRKYFPSDFYNHGSATIDPTAWAIWQYNDPSTGEGVVLAFRRAAAPSSRATISLKGLPKGATVEVENLDTGAKSTVKDELEIALPDRRSSTVILYRTK